MSLLHNWSNFDRVFPYTSIRDEQYMLIEKLLAAQDGDRMILEASTGVGKSIAALSSLITRMIDSPQDKLVIFTRTINQMEPFLREWSLIMNKSTISQKSENSDLQPRQFLMLPLVGKSRLCRMQEVLEQQTPHNISPNTTQETSQSDKPPCMALPIDLSLQIRADQPIVQLHKGDPCPFYPRGRRRTELRKINRKIDLAYSLPDYLLPQNYSIDGIRKFIENTGQCAYYGLRSIMHHARIVLLPHYYLDPATFPKIAQKLRMGVEDLYMVVDEAHHLLEYTVIKVETKEIRKLLNILGKIPWLDNLYTIMRQTSNKRIPAEQLFPSELQSVSRFLHLLKVYQQELPQLLEIEEIKNIVTKLEELIAFRERGTFLMKGNTLRMIEFSPKQRLAVFEEARLMIFQSATFYDVKLIQSAMQQPTAITHTTRLNREAQEFRSYLFSTLTSKRANRSAKLYNKMAETIIQLHEVNGKAHPVATTRLVFDTEVNSSNQRSKHTLVFLPSYEFLEAVAQEIRQQVGNSFEVITEYGKLSEQELNQQILQAKQAIILANASGKIAEGNEWVVNGHSLISQVIMAGLPYGVLDDEDQHWLEVLRKEEFVPQKFGRPVTDLTLSIPVMIKIEQCFGRAIRSRRDKAALVILDYRAERVQKELGLKRFGNLDRLLGDVTSFFEDS